MCPTVAHLVPPDEAIAARGRGRVVRDVLDRPALLVEALPLGPAGEPARCTVRNHDRLAVDNKIRVAHVLASASQRRVLVARRAVGITRVQNALGADERTALA
jgi:hypothetical protein